MADQKLVLDALTEIAHTLVRRYAIVDVLVHLADQIVPTISLFGAGVSVGDDTGNLRFVTASDDHLIEDARPGAGSSSGRALRRVLPHLRTGDESRPGGRNPLANVSTRGPSPWAAFGGRRPAAGWGELHRQPQHVRGDVPRQ